MQNWSMRSIYVAIVCFSCFSCSNPEIKIAQDTVYDQSFPDSNLEYLIEPGDEFEIIYQFDSYPAEAEYLLAVGDVIDVEFYQHPETNKQVKIRPDGKITLPLKGEIAAAGITPEQLKEKIAKLFRDEFRDPLVTISLVEYHHPVDQLKESIKSFANGSVKLVTVRPDGYITFPLLEDIRTSGLKVSELQTVVLEKYGKKYDSLNVSLSLQAPKSNLVYVMGEVRKPDYYLMEGPTSVTQVLARAGGILDTAEKKTVMVVTRNNKNQCMARLVDVDKILTEGNMANDLLLKQYDVVYVPKSKIALSNLFIDQYINQIIPTAFRTNLGLVYRLNSKDDGSE